MTPDPLRNAELLNESFRKSGVRFWGVPVIWTIDYSILGSSGPLRGIITPTSEVVEVKELLEGLGVKSRTSLFRPRQHILLAWGVPKIRDTILGALIIGVLVFWGLYWGTPILGNYHFSPKQAPTKASSKVSEKKAHLGLAQAAVEAVETPRCLNLNSFPKP